MSEFFSVSKRFKCTWWDCTEDRCLPSVVAAPPAPSDVHSLCSVLLFCLAGAAADFSPWLTDCLCPWTHCKEKELYVVFFCFVFSNQNPWLTTLLFQPRLCGEYWNKSVWKRWKPAFCLNLACLQSKPSQNSNVNQSLISTVPPLLQLTFL